MRERIMNWLIKFLMKQGNYPATPTRVSAAKSIVIIGAPSDKAEQNALLQFQSYLQSEGQTVNLFYYRMSEDYLPQSREISTSIAWTKSDVNLLGFPKKRLRQKLKEMQPQVVINLAPPEWMAAHAMSALTGPAFRLAFSTEKYDYIYDFMVETQGDASLSNKIEVLKTYINRIQKQ